MLWFEEKDALKKRLADYEAENIVSHQTFILHAVTVSAITLLRIFVLLQQLLSKVSSMENETSRISEHLEREKVQIITLILVSPKAGV